MASRFVKGFTKGSKNVKITKVAKGSTKKDFVDGMLTDSEFLKKVSTWMDLNSVKNGTLRHNPNEARLHAEFIDMIASQNMSGKTVSIERGSVMPPKPTAPMKAKMATMMAGPTAKAPTSGPDKGTFIPTVDKSSAKQPQWLTDVVAVEMERWTKDTQNTRAPFHQWAKDEGQATAQREVVRQLEAAGNAGKFAQLKTSGGKGDFAAVELVAIVAGSIAAAAGIETQRQKEARERQEAQNKKVSAIVKGVVANMDPGTLSQASMATTSATSATASAKSVQPLTRQDMVDAGLPFPDAALKQYRRSIDERYNSLVSHLGKSANASTWARAVAHGTAAWEDYLANRTTTGDRSDELDDDPSSIFKGIPQPPAGKGGFTTTMPFPTGFQFGDETEHKGPPPSITIPGFGGGQTSTGGPSDPPAGGGSFEDSGSKPPGGKTETDEPFPEPGGGVITDQGTGKRPKNKPIARPRPIPPRGGGTPGDDSESDDDEAPRVVNPDPEQRANVVPELRPFMKAGGEDMLRVDDARKRQELTDWALFNFVPGYTYQGDDNPLTMHNKRQYEMRMNRTEPDPTVWKPRDFTGGQPRTIMRNVYQRDQPFVRYNDRGKYRGRYMTSDQDRGTHSTLMNINPQHHNYCDVAGRTGPESRMKGVRDLRNALRFSTASIF